MQRQLPNLITVLRFALSPLLLWLILNERFVAALGLSIVMGLSDAIDGALSKAYGWNSRFGALADPIADKMMINCAIAGLAWLQLLPIWFAILILLRDFIIIGGAIAYQRYTKTLPIAPTFLSKVNTCLQITLGLWTLLAQVVAVPTLIGTLLLAMTAATTIASGIHYPIKSTLQAKRFMSQFRKPDSKTAHQIKIFKQQNNMSKMI